MGDWVPYDVIVTADEAPDSNYISIDDAPAPWVTGPDADGLYWIHGETGGVRGMVSVRADSLAGKAFAQYARPLETVAASPA